MKRLQFAIAAISSIVSVSGLVAISQPARAPLVQIRLPGMPPFLVDLAAKGSTWDCTEFEPTVCYYIDLNGDGIFETPAETRGSYFSIE